MLPSAFSFRIACVALAAAASGARAQLTPEWVTSVPAGTSLSAGMGGMCVGPGGVTYITGTGGPLSYSDVLTAAISAQGQVLWSRAYDGPGNWHDQGRAVALGPGGVVHVTGNTPGGNFFAAVLLLRYDGVTGAMLDEVIYSSGPGLSEAGHALAVDGAGGVYIGGSTTGDGGDALILKLDAAGAVQWVRVWDGPAFAPYSQDSVQSVALDPAGDLVVLIHGVMGSLHPDYVVVKYDKDDGAVVWQSNWGVGGGDFPSDMAIDAGGDIYVTGTGINLTDMYSTIKLRGSDGGLLWQEYDHAGYNDGAIALALDGRGGVCITGSIDPDGNVSNQNDNIYTVNRDAATGALRWTFLYGDNCIGCLDTAGDVAVDRAGHVLVCGNTSSAPYSGDMILFVHDPETGAEMNRGVVGGGPLESAWARFMALDGADSLRIGGRLYHVNTGAVGMPVIRFAALSGGCYADCDGSGVLNVSDFICFQTKFAQGDPYADCDGNGQRNVNDYICFQTGFALGCP